VMIVGAGLVLRLGSVFEPARPDEHAVGHSGR